MATEDRECQDQGHPFPPLRPDVAIVETKCKIDHIDCMELQWWFAIPRLGDRTMYASYEVDTGELSAVTKMIATTPAQVHGLDCVEIGVSEWSPVDGWHPMVSSFYCTSARGESKWLAVITSRQGRKVLSTFRDEGFEQNWGGCGKQRLHDDGRYQAQADGSYRLADRKGLGAGVYDVAIGEACFRCLRVLDPGGSVSEYDELSEAYVDEGTGRTVLYRQYRGRLMTAEKGDLTQKYPANCRIDIDGCVYVQCDCTGRAHDVITHTALKI